MPSTRLDQDEDLQLAIALSKSLMVSTQAISQTCGPLREACSGLSERERFAHRQVARDDDGAEESNPSATSKMPPEMLEEDEQEAAATEQLQVWEPTLDASLHNG